MSTKTKTTKKSEVSKNEVSKQEVPVVSTPAPAAEKKSRAKAAKAEAPVVETKEAAPKTKKERKPKAVKAEAASAGGAAEESPVSETSTKVKRAVDKESLEARFDELLASLSAEVDVARSAGAKYKAVPFIKNVVRNMKVLKNDSLKLCKKKSRTAVKMDNPTSGLMKPVNVSADMVKFANWSPSELKSRVDVTKFICNYVKSNNLQNPKDKRQILPDEKLTKLLNFDTKSKEPLTYYTLQKLIQPLFSKKE